MTPLTDLERGVLDIAGRWYRHPGGRIEAVRDELGLSEARYLQILARLRHHDGAWAHAPHVMSSVARRVTRPAPASARRVPLTT